MTALHGNGENRVLRVAVGIVAAMASLIPGAAFAEPMPYDGRWGFGLDTCALKPGESDMVPTVIADGEIDYYESYCTIDSSEPIGSPDGAAWRVKLSCGGEGETWTSESIFAIDDGAGERPRQWIDIDVASGSVIVRQECGG
jgi:hypothetical protein